MKILHIASFIGNLGDLLSHHGLHGFLRERFGDTLIIDTLEIRRFHRNAPADWKLDLGNVLRDVDGTYDRIIIGGGGFLDYWVPGSQTGSSVDVAPELLGTLKTPLIISSVGAYPAHQPPAENYDLFRRFLEAVADAPQVRLMLRNDGSYAHVADTFGAEIVADVTEAGDHCYLIRPEQEEFADGWAGLVGNDIRRPYICINLAPDQITMHAHMREPIDSDHFYRDIAAGLLAAAEGHDADVMFAPHLPLDYRAVLKLVEHLPDAFVRERFRAAPFDGTPAIIPAALSIYRGSLVNVCARLHSNIISHVLKRPTVAMGVLSRVISVAEQHPETALVDDYRTGLNDRIERAVDRAIADGGAAARPADTSTSDIRRTIESFLDDALA